MNIMTCAGYRTRGTCSRVTVSFSKFIESNNLCPSFTVPNWSPLFLDDKQTDNVSLFQFLSLKDTVIEPVKLSPRNEGGQGRQERENDERTPHQSQ